MPTANRFRHQVYHSAVPTSPHHLCTPPSDPPIESDAFRSRMQAVGDVYRAAGVTAIYLVHGTFVGDDALGLFATLGRLFPKYEAELRKIAKLAIDALIGDAGNYTPKFAQRFERSIHREGTEPIRVRLFPWSGQNNHIGRADAAVRLIEELARIADGGLVRNAECELRIAECEDVDDTRLGSATSQTEEHDVNPKSGIGNRKSYTHPHSEIPNPHSPPPRILLWGHSHAGNAFALLSNLLAADEETLRHFFTATRSHFQWPICGCVDVPRWPRVWKMLQATERPIDRLALDFVTFGTPVRYGWDTAGYSNLLHVINHRPSSERPTHLAPFPPKLDRLEHARDGDFVQQFGIAGTNLAPSLLEWRSFLADDRLNKLLQPGLRKRDFLGRLEIGARVPDEGTTLLVLSQANPGWIILIDA